jgi:DNA modification methylase
MMSPYYRDEWAAIYHGDCRKILPMLKGVDAIITDPPYGVSWNTDYTRFTSGFGAERKKHMPVSGDAEPFDPGWLNGYPTLILWGANIFSNKLTLGSWLVWDKRHKNGTAFLADGEAAWWNRGHGIYIYSETSQGCIRNEPIEHPTQKPEGLMRWCIQMAQPKLVCDPYMGSGTTLRAAKDLRVPCIGIELELEYCATAKRRLRQEVLPLSYDQMTLAIGD